MDRRFQRMGGTRNEFVTSAVPGGAASVVDIGSGEGWMLGQLAHVPRRVGVDTDTAALGRAKRRYPECDFRELDGGRLPFPDGEFEVAVLSEVLEHVGDANKQQVVDEALRVLEQGGVLIVTVPHRGVLSFLDPLDFKRRLPRLYGLYRRIAGGSPQTSMEIGHKHLSLREVLRLLGDRADIERVVLSGWLSPLFDLAQAACSVIPVIPNRVVWRLGRLKARESGVAAPRLLASHLRIVACKRGRSSVQPVQGFQGQSGAMADKSPDGPSAPEFREAEATPSAQAQVPARR